MALIWLATFLSGFCALIYQVAWVPFKLLPSDFILVIIAAPLICFAATLYPARRAAKLVITEALRFE